MGWQKIEKILKNLGVNTKVKIFQKGTKTSQEAADQIGVKIGQIAKSLVFIAGQRPILVIASGQNRVSEEKLVQITGSLVKLATPEQVKQLTGFVVGGVPPVGHKTKLTTFIDQDLLTYSLVWAAGGTPQTVFPIKPEKLVKITRGRIVKIKT